MNITGIGWAGTRTQHQEEMTRFCTDVLGIQVKEHGEDLSAFILDDGSKFEVFGPGYQDKGHMTTGPVVGFVVTDLDGAIDELRAAGVELLGEVGPTWVHFRAPDGNVYELTTGANQTT